MPLPLAWLVGTLLVAPGWLSVPASAAAVGPVSARDVQSSTDTVVIRFVADVVSVAQRIPTLDDAVEAHAIRFDGQELHIDRATRSGEILDGSELDRLSGAYRLRIGGPGPVDLRYRVTGLLDRVPLFVASPEAQLTSAPVTLRVELVPESSVELDLATSLPRFRRTSEGVLTATLSSLPAFVRLDAAGLSFARAADLAVVILILLAAAWAWLTARRAGVPTPGGGSAPRDGEAL